MSGAVCERCGAPVFGDFCACLPQPDSRVDAAADEIIALRTVRDLIELAQVRINELDPSAAIPQLLDARRAIRQAVGAVDTYEQRIVEGKR